MATKSSYMSRFSLSRGDSPLLPLHTKSSHPLRSKPSEYDLDELSPRPEDALLTPEPGPRSTSSADSLGRRSPFGDASDRSGTPGSASKMKPRVLFAGPPPPIATSTVLYRDVEDRGPSSRSRGGSGPSSARNAIGSILFDRSSTGSRDRAAAYEPDSVWRSLQRREKAIQNDLQGLLDIQAAGLLAGLNRPLNPSSSPGPASDAGSSTPTGTSYTSRSSRLATDYSTPAGEVIPVRQPRPRKMGLRAARSGLAKNMAMLADLKAEEDASLATALSARKQALAQLRKLSGRHDGIIQELRSLEDDEGEPLTQQLHELADEHQKVSRQISEMEQQLMALRRRQKVLAERLEDVNNQRESGLSGYRGALKEVEGQITTLLRRPPVAPLDFEALKPPAKSGGATNGNGIAETSPGGIEFLRLRPERRTPGMAKDWWEGEVALLEKRKREVDKDRAALEEGAEVWQEAVQLVSDFEADLRKQVTGDEDDTGKGKQRSLTQEEKMHSQLGRMAAVITGLEQRLRIAESKGWNLLICAIGAELEAFKEAERMVQDTLRAAGFDMDEDVTPRLARSVVEAQARSKTLSRVESDTLVDTQDDGAAESDNEVPPDLFATHVEEYEGDAEGRRSGHEPHLQEGDSENEVPPEFLAEHDESGSGGP